MNYKSFYEPDSNFDIFNCDDDENVNRDDYGKQKNSLTEEESINILNSAGESLFLSFSEPNKNLLRIRDSLRLFKNLKYINDLSDLYFNSGIFANLTFLLNLNSANSLEPLPDYVSNTIEEIVQLTFRIIFQMTHYSESATEHIASSDFIKIFVENEEDYSTISKCYGFYTISNIFLSMPNDAFIQFFQEICNLLNSKDEYIQMSGKAKLFLIIWDERNNKSLQLSLFNLLHIISYRISNLDQQNEISKYLSNYIKEKIFEVILKDTITIKPEARKELLYAVYHLCCAFPDISAYVASDISRLMLFKNNFLSSNPEDIEFSLRFFCLLFYQSPTTEIKIGLLNLIPWNKLLIQLENHSLAWHPYFFQVVSEMSVDSVFVEKFCEYNVYSTIFKSFYELKADSRIAIGNMFAQILGRAPAEICVFFVQNKILQIFFDLLDFDLDSELIFNILNALHIINQKFSEINQLDIARQEYTEDNISILHDISEFPNEVHIICQELGLED